MDWFDGSIAHAIQSAKASNSLFVVVVHGKHLWVYRFLTIL